MSWGFEDMLPTPDNSTGGVESKGKPTQLASLGYLSSMSEMHEVCEIIVRMRAVGCNALQAYLTKV